MGAGLERVLDLVREERGAQDAKWGEQNHGDHPTLDEYAALVALVEAHARAALRRTASWGEILLEEVAEALQEDDPGKLRRELVQVAAVAVAWIEAIDRRPPPTPLPDPFPDTDTDLPF